MVMSRIPCRHTVHDHNRIWIRIYRICDHQAYPIVWAGDCGHVDLTKLSMIRVIWGWAENLSWRVTGPLVPIWIYLVGFWDLGRFPIDRKLLGDRFGRILSPGSAIFVNFEGFWPKSIWLGQIPKS